jgi:CheY-like chemotaxis protein
LGFDWAAVRSIPRVESLTLFPAYTSLTIAGIDDDSITSFIPADTDAMRTIERPVVLEGRLADPTRPDEAVVTAAFLRSTGRHVGDTLTALLTTPQQADASGTTEDPPAGPRVPLRIVGVVRSLWYSDAVGGPGSVIPSPGLLTRYRANLLGASGNVPLSALVRLRGGEADLPAFRADLARVSGRPDIDVLDRADAVRHARDVTAFQSASLVAFGLAALLAAVVIVGQVIVGYAASSAGELRSVAALGMTGGQGMLLTAAAPSLAATVGAGLGVAGAATAEAALRVAEADLAGPPPAVLVTDTDLAPDGMDGLALAAEARRRWPGLGVVFVTGRPSRLDGQVLRARDRFLPKPVRRAALVRAVRGLVGASSRRAP